jgi:hypothetical protein
MKISLINEIEIFERISNGKPFNSDLKPYSKLEVASAIKLLERDEQYEKCAILYKFYKNRFRHDYNYLICL